MSRECMVNNTLDYYNQNAISFVENTVSVDFSDNQNKFISKLQKGDYILDFGCGSGRDTRHFLDKGFKVDAIDGSEELCKLASDYTGIEVKHMLFQELNDTDKYDAIWACSSILHLPHNELRSVLQKMVKALKNNGIIYTSFKYGTHEGIRNGRFFSDFTKESFDEFIRDMDQMQVVEHWLTCDVRPDREDEKWLNLLVKKEV